MSERIEFYVGSYTKPELEGIYHYSIDVNSLEYTKISSVRGIEDPSYLYVDSQKNKLYAVMETFEFQGEPGGAVASFDFDAGQIKLQTAENVSGTLPCHIAMYEDKGYIFTANYWSGSVTMLKLDEQKNVVAYCNLAQHKGTGPNQERQEGPHAHFCGLSKDKSGIWVVDLGIDSVIYYKIDTVHHKLLHEAENDILLPKGVGPRHFVWHREIEGLMYVVCELSSEIYVVDTVNGNEIVQSISTLPKGVTESACAAIRMSEDGGYVYVSNRGDDSIAVFKVLESGELQIIEIVPTAGKNPRDFNLKGELLLIANQDTNTVNIFKVEKATGHIVDTKQCIFCCKPSCIAF